MVLPLSCTFLDQEHVNVLSSKRKKAPHPTNQLSAPLIASSTIPPVPSNLVEKIEAGKFIEIGDLVPSHFGFEETAGSKPKQRSITNISEWLQAFTIYVSFVSKKHVLDLMGYQILMLEASNEYQNNRWLAYDRRFRLLAASQPSCKWSNTDSTLWSLAFTGQAKVNRCKHCFSLFHQSIDCEFASSSTSSSRDQTHQAPGYWRFICHQWNEQHAQGCTFPNYRYEHVCYYCSFNSAVKDIHHKALFCPNPPAQQSTTNQWPGPLFQWCRLRSKNF